MQAILLIPHNGSQFHLGETGLADCSDLLHSDTLFSALANVYEFALSGAKTFIDLFRNDKLTFSSGLFTMLKKGSQEPPLLFFPKPAVTYSNVTDRKHHKSIKFLSQGVMDEFRKSFDAQKCVSNLDLTSWPLIGNEFLCLADELGRNPEAFRNRSFLGFITTPKIKVHTTIQDNDRLYHETTLKFNSFSVNGEKYEGAYCVLLKADLTVGERQEFFAALRIMADEGIGGQRSSGKGQFREIREVDIDIPCSEQAATYLGLSIVSPANGDEFDALERYELFVRGGGSLGWRGEAEKHRKQARFVKEGSVMRRNIAGTILNVSPDIGDGLILRNGKNFAIPI